MDASQKRTDFAISFASVFKATLLKDNPYLKIRNKNLFAELLSMSFFYHVSVM